MESGIIEHQPYTIEPYMLQRHTDEGRTSTENVRSMKESRGVTWQMDF